MLRLMVILFCVTLIGCTTTKRSPRTTLATRSIQDPLQQARAAEAQKQYTQARQLYETYLRQAHPSDPEKYKIEAHLKDVHLKAMAQNSVMGLAFYHHTKLTQQEATSTRQNQMRRISKMRILSTQLRLYPRLPFHLFEPKTQPGAKYFPDVAKRAQQRNQRDHIGCMLLPFGCQVSQTLMNTTTWRTQQLRARLSPIKGTHVDHLNPRSVLKWLHFAQTHPRHAITAQARNLILRQTPLLTPLGLWLAKTFSYIRPTWRLFKQLTYERQHHPTQAKKTLVTLQKHILKNQYRTSTHLIYQVVKASFELQDRAQSKRFIEHIGTFDFERKLNPAQKREVLYIYAQLELMEHIKNMDIPIEQHDAESLEIWADFNDINTLPLTPRHHPNYHTIWTFLFEHHAQIDRTKARRFLQRIKRYVDGNNTLYHPKKVTDYLRLLHRHDPKEAQRQALSFLKRMVPKTRMTNKHVYALARMLEYAMDKPVLYQKLIHILSNVEHLPIKNDVPVHLLVLLKHNRFKDFLDVLKKTKPNTQMATLFHNLCRTLLDQRIYHEGFANLLLKYTHHAPKHYQGQHLAYIFLTYKALKKPTQPLQEKLTPHIPQLILGLLQADEIKIALEIWRQHPKTQTNANLWHVVLKKWQTTKDVPTRRLLYRHYKTMTSAYYRTLLPQMNQAQTLAFKRDFVHAMARAGHCTHLSYINKGLSKLIEPHILTMQQACGLNDQAAEALTLLNTHLDATNRVWYITQFGTLLDTSGYSQTPKIQNVLKTLRL